MHSHNYHVHLIDNDPRNRDFPEYIGTTPDTDEATMPLTIYKFITEKYPAYQGRKFRITYFNGEQMKDWGYIEFSESEIENA